MPIPATSRLFAALATRTRLAWGHCRPGRARADANAGELDAEFLSLGCSLVVLDEVGDGVPDRLVGFRGHAAFVEYKSPQGRMRDGQHEFMARWRGCPVHVVRTREEARRVFGALL